MGVALGLLAPSSESSDSRQISSLCVTVLIFAATFGAVQKHQ